ncbi:hypothetical protein E1267_20940 [Nonomuraea longispora]|uniref:DUF4439 domain-containing protein n=1 Tax=Nonomuraea longispora TaxID=1848320 RepID=A0A4R4NE36_9ACTN|nr:hypothetical protein [Nonomuraea longispora]TDC04972.1 hypothetical protein E1267_20940 [Nonomuraea longispora]
MSRFLVGLLREQWEVKPVRPRQLSRRALLAGGAAALTSCSAAGPSQPSSPPSDSPETVLAKGLIAEKESTIALYSSLIADGAQKLVPFRERHQAHVDALRRHAPMTSPAAAGSPSGSPSGRATPSAPQKKPSLARLRALEGKAAARRARQLAGLSPGMAQLVASIGACEAAHAAALPRSL